VLTLESCSINRRVACDNGGALRLHDDSCLELGHKFAGFLSEHGVGDDHVVVHALTNTNFSRSLVLHGADGEGQSRESFVKFHKEGAGALHFEVVNLLEFTLEHGAAGVVLLGLSLTGRDEDVEADNIAGSELEFVDVLSGGGSVDDHIVAVNDVSLDLVGKDALDSVALEFFSDLLNNFSHLVVGGGNGDFAASSLEGVVSSKNNVSLASSDGAGSDNNGSCGVRSISIEVGTAHAIIKVKRRSFG